MTFDEKWYLEQCPYARQLNMTPLEHYKKYGKYLGYTPTKQASNTKSSLIISKDDLNICIASSGIQGPTGAGGVAKCTLNLIELIDNINRSKTKRINLTILYTADPFYHSKNYEYWKSHFELKYLYVKFEKVDSSRKVYGSKMMKRSYDIMNYFLKSNFSFDKIIFHDYQGIGFYTLLAKKSLLGFKNTEIIVNTHGNLRLSSYFGKKPVCDSDDLITMHLETKSVELADTVISPSKFYLDWWQNQIGVDKPILNSEVLHNITLKEVAPASQVNTSDKPFKHSISFFGRLEILKGVDLLIQSLIIMSEKEEYSNFFANSTSKCDTRLCRLTVLFEYLDRL
ncbi:hypothetical protein ACK35A_20645, partial [Aeromonas veronii]